MHSYLTLMRLDKPIGIWLLFFPAAWAVALVAPQETMGVLLLAMLLGAALTRSAGCVLNDLIDRRLDAQVARTRHRPLASGAVSLCEAIVLLALLLVAAFVLALTIIGSEIWPLATIAVAMIATYPWMKRVTGWPQIFLGLTFNLGVLFGGVAAGASLWSPTLWMLYAAGICWTLGYDTIYAVQDMADDAVVGIRSSARTLGVSRLRGFVGLCYGLGVALLIWAGSTLDAQVPYYMGVALMAIHCVWQVRQLPCDATRAGVLFRSNQWAGLMFLIGIAVDRVVAF